MIGVAWDGTGYGTDGNIWGGEFLVADYGVFRRAGQLEYLPMPGGDLAIRRPYRLAIGYLYALTGQLEDLHAYASEEELRIIQDQVDKGINCPLTSAAGRLFDAVSAMLGVRSLVSYEAQAAVELETRASASELFFSSEVARYPFAIDVGNQPMGDGRRHVRLRGMIEAILEDLRSSVPVQDIAYRFHLTLAYVIQAMCVQVRDDTGIDTVALSGGCFQNRLLFQLALPLLHRAGFQTLVHRQVPTNDGCISLGQAAIAHSVREGQRH